MTGIPHFQSDIKSQFDFKRKQKPNVFATGEHAFKTLPRKSNLRSQPELPATYGHIHEHLSSMNQPEGERILLTQVRSCLSSSGRTVPGSLTVCLFSLLSHFQLYRV